jgi:hypothetical protein
MILGMSLSTFTLMHVVISLLGIFTGLVVAAGMLGAKRLPAWSMLFLLTSMLTSVTGFMFPFPGIDPAKIVGAASLVILAVALFALYVKHVSGSWRWIYVIAALVVLYLNVFVAVVQAFQKIAFLRSLAPTQKEPPFVIAQLLVVALFVVWGVLAIRKFHPRSISRPLLS